MNLANYFNTKLIAANFLLVLISNLSFRGVEPRFHFGAKELYSGICCLDYSLYQRSRS